MNAKYQRVASELEQRIRAGSLTDGDKLPGEAELARELDVSRGTVRQALGELQRRNLISTQVGVGSFVTFDGVPLDAAAGWAHALTRGGAAITTEVLSISPIAREDIPDLPHDVPFAEGVAVRRIRRMGDGSAVSFECSTVPSVGPLRDLARTGLLDGSLTASIAAAGLRTAYGDQHLSIVALPAREAALMSVAAGIPFLRTVRTARTDAGELVEHVVSYLDPEHFQLHITFGEHP